MVVLLAQGGGLFIGYGGVANLESCNVCSNTATSLVCSSSEPSQTVILQLFQHRVTEPTRDVTSPAWIISYSLYIQGAGILIDGSADLTDCNIHDNVADAVSFLLLNRSPWSGSR